MPNYLGRYSHCRYTRTDARGRLLRGASVQSKMGSCGAVFRVPCRCSAPVLTSTYYVVCTAYM